MMMILRLISSRIFCRVVNFKKSLFLTKTIQFAKDAEAALMRPDVSLRADKITTGFFEILSTVSNFQNSLFVTISDQNDPYCQGCGRGPDAALRTIQMLLFGLGRVRAARGPHPF